MLINTSTGALFTYFDGVSRDQLVDTVRVCAQKTNNGATLIGQAMTAAARRRAQGHVAPKAAKIAVLAVRLAVASLEAIDGEHEAIEPLVGRLRSLMNLRSSALECIYIYTTHVISPLSLYSTIRIPWLVINW